MNRGLSTSVIGSGQPQEQRIDEYAEHEPGTDTNPEDTEGIKAH